ncbi:MAG TPA: hypothetical protein DEO94_01560 [Cyanobacteria bacterium UBA11991]|nr:hypothetical protein [Cyanobacteriota bacterium]MDY6359329.1 hypothetical protein [Cyanobacteriota bacterium]MDY6363937.1 hypothetical protein [Cyanobacteriota bacterium]MDY6383294.1 hypothetical protein [Cyanobacteriota bacterium]HCB10844.1 hypothetical protein [Cyanobacteria bacterium UBA11991]
MKKAVFILALLMIAPLAANADENQQKVNYYTPYFNQGNIIQGKQVQYAEKNSKVYKKSSGNDYILKYNIDDLEAAPWINGGKRNYK